MTADRGATAPRWRPSLFIRLSIALHAASLAVLALRPSLWPWLLALVAANHAIILTSVFLPRGRLLGANVLRLPRACADRGEIALTFDDGPDPLVTPCVLDLLDRHGMKATFFCIGTRVSAHPQLAAEIVRRGHTLANHSYGHTPWFAMLGPRRMGRDIDAAQAEIARAAGSAPRFFRAPNGFRNPWLDPLLAKRAMTYVAWTRRGLDTVRRDASGVTRTLVRGLTAGEVLLLHDGNCGRTREGAPMVLEVLPKVLEHVARSGLKSVALHSALRTH